MKTLKYLLIFVLVFIIVVTTYYAIDRYLINDNQKGISPEDILNICLFLILPISVGLFIIKRFEKK